MKLRTWLWSAAALADETVATNILRFARQAGVKVIYLFLSNSVSDLTYQQFNYLANGIGIEVHAVIGERELYHPSRLPEIEEKLERIAVINSYGDPSEMFTGVHFDIEPYSLPVWQDPATRPQALAAWQETIQGYTAYARNAFDLALSVALPLQLRHDEYADFRRECLLLHDKIVVMAYRNIVAGADSIMYHSEPFLISAEEEGHYDSVIIAVETKPLDPAKQSFATLGKGPMYEALKSLNDLYVYRPAFAGFAVHSLEYWQPLPYLVH